MDTFDLEVNVPRYQESRSRELPLSTSNAASDSTACHTHGTTRMRKAVYTISMRIMRRSTIARISIP